MFPSKEKNNHTLKEDKKVGKNYVAPELNVWENDDLDVIRTSSIGEPGNADNGGNDIDWVGFIVG